MTIEEFERHRPLMRRLAYRLLGTITDAEDVVQDAWIRSSAAGPVHSPRAYLSTIVTRLCLDQLDSLRLKREQYVGQWLPEPSMEPPDASGDVSYALLVVLHALSPVERAVYLLREIFDLDYGQIATALETSETNCRQILHRARNHVEQRRVRFTQPPQRSRQLIRAFLQAAAKGDLDVLSKMLTEDAIVYSDGGGKAHAAVNPVLGADKVARFFAGIAKKAANILRMRIVEMQGGLAVVGLEDGAVRLVANSSWNGDRLAEFYIVLNPDKLTRLELPPMANS